MKTKAVPLTWLAVFWICCYSTQAFPVESEKGKDEFIFLLPAGDGGSNLYSGISINLEPPLVDSFRNARDSYGNPVSPYAATEDGKKPLNVAALQFEIPSYASGITEIRKPINELLPPPLASGQVPNDALQIPVVAQPPVELLPPLSIDASNIPKDTAINEVTDRIDTEPTSPPESKNKEEDKPKPQKPEDHSDPEKYDGERYTGGFGGPSGFLGEQREKGYAIKEKEEKEAKEEESSLKAETKDQNAPSATEPVPPPSLPSQNNQPESPQPPRESDTQFPSVINSVFSPVSTPTDEPSVGLEPNKISQDAASAAPLTPVPGVSSDFGSNPPQLIPTTVPHAELPPSPVTESQGLSSIAPPTQAPTVSSSSDNIPAQQTPVTPPSFVFSPPFAGRFGAEKDVQSNLPSQSPFPALPKFPGSLSPVPPFAQPNLAPGFGFTGPLFPAQPISGGPDKFTGSFGGAPGVLGNQAKPGYAVQPDGSIRDPDHTYRPPVGGVSAIAPTPAPTHAPAPAHHNPVVAPVKYEKYNGGFGGPPGVLAPFDKH